MKKKLLLALLALSFIVACNNKSQTPTPDPIKNYVGGYYIVNEGWFGHEAGSINHFDPTSQKLSERIYTAANPSLNLGTTTCYGAKWQGSLYIVSKQGLRLVVIDELSFAKRGSLSNLSGADGRAFAGINESWAVVTTSKGAYLASLNPLAIGEQLDKTAGIQCGAVYATKDNVFVIAQGKGIYIYSIADNYKFVASHPKGSVGFTKSKDGSLWAADGNTLIKINPNTLAIEEIAMPTDVTINNSWGAWNAGSLCASPIENWLYFTKSGTWGGGREIYRYKIGDITSLNQVFATSTVADDNFYGSGIGIDSESGDILATFVKEGWNDYDDNRLVVFDGKTGAEKSRFSHKNYYFPAMIISNN